MNRIREHLSAWFVVALLATGLVAVWGVDHLGQADAVACNEAGMTPAGITLPRGAAWQPDPALVGWPRAERDTTAYEVAEARSLERLGVSASPRFIASRQAGGAAATATC